MLFEAPTINNSEEEPKIIPTGSSEKPIKSPEDKIASAIFVALKDAADLIDSKADRNKVTKNLLTEVERMGTGENLNEEVFKILREKASAGFHEEGGDRKNSYLRE